MAERIIPFNTLVPGDLDVDVDSTQALRITGIGTDRGTAITPSVNGDQLGSVITEIGDIHPINTAEQGVLQLGLPPNVNEPVQWPLAPHWLMRNMQLYYYVPPDGTLSFDGASGDQVRLQGQRLDGVGSRFEAQADQTRFEEQGEHHWTFSETTTTVSEQIADGATATIHTESPATDERVTFAGAQMMAITSGGVSLSDGDIDVFWDLDGQRFPSQFNQDDAFTVDINNMPRPPDDTSDQVPFIWGHYGAEPSPLVVEGDQDLDVNIRNVSGGALGTGGETSDFTFTAAVIFDERR